MTPIYNSFVESVKHHFENEVKIPTDQFRGAILYTSHASLKPQQYLFMGLNPSGCRCNSKTIQHYLDKAEDSSYNQYEDDWSTESCPECSDKSKPPKVFKYEKGCHPLQLNIKHICSLLGLSVDEICSENLVYAPSHGSTELWQRYTNKKPGARNEIESLYWPVHKMILDIVQPKVIITYGNDETFSPYWFLREIAKSESKDIDLCEIKTKETGHNPYFFKTFTGIINGRKTRVVGLPHLSYYKLYTGDKKQLKNDAFAKFMQEHLNITLN